MPETTPPAPAQRARLPYVDVLRLTAAFLVIVGHTVNRIFLNHAPSPSWYGSLAVFYTAKSAIPVFLMLTGAVSLGRPVDRSRYLRKVRRAAVVLLAANLVYYLWGLIAAGRLAEFSPADLAYTVFHGAHSSLWYLYAYLAAMLFLPFLQKLAAVLSRREERLLLILTVGLSGLLRFLPALWPRLELNEAFHAMSLGAYVGLIFAGHYAETYWKPTRKTALLAALTILAVTALELAVTRRLYGLNPNDWLKLERSVQLTYSVKGVCLFLCAKALVPAGAALPKGGALLGRLGGLSFGVYLLGTLLIGLLEPFYAALTGVLPWYLALPLLQAAVFLAGLGITALLKRIPGLRNYL